ncbi:MAG: hypothetical protein PHI35_03270 [Victivallaceae bacterium]|nr:hypothetical protein [Victivallaceae bacterium]
MNYHILTTSEKSIVAVQNREKFDFLFNPSDLEEINATGGFDDESGRLKLVYWTYNSTKRMVRVAFLVIGKLDRETFKGIAHALDHLRERFIVVGEVSSKNLVCLHICQKLGGVVSGVVKGAENDASDQIIVVFDKKGEVYHG